MMDDSDATLPDPLPADLAAWQGGGLSPRAALALFDRLGPVEPEEMAGLWRGSDLPSGHPLDGLLGALGWYGKAFHGPDRVDPLLFRGRGGRIVALDPARLPLRLALALPGLARSPVARAGFTLLRPLLVTRRPAARLRQRTWRGVPSAAMLYDRKPITDHFRRAGPGLVVGAMEARGMRAPFFFLLRRVAPDPARARGGPSRGGSAGPKDTSSNGKNDV